MHGSQTVSNQMVLTRTAGTASVVAAGGNPANNGNGDIANLFQLTSGSSYTFRVDVQASDPFFALGQACPAVYDPSHASAGGGGDISKVDVAFYYSDCGDGVRSTAPSSVIWAARNGAAAIVLHFDLYVRAQRHDLPRLGRHLRRAGGLQRVGPDLSGRQQGASGTICRASAGICDVQEICNGVANSCPADGFASTSVVCRAVGGGLRRGRELHRVGRGLPGRCASSRAGRPAAPRRAPAMWPRRATDRTTACPADAVQAERLRVQRRLG